MKTKLGLVLFSCIAVVIGGCCLFPVNVLTGNWALTTDSESALDSAVLIFDSNDQLSEIQFTVNGQVIISTSPTSTTTVSGSTVTITVSISQGTLTFVGTLSDDQNTINGTLTTALTFGNITITLPGVPATMTRLLT